MKNPFEKFFSTKKEEDGGPRGAPKTEGADIVPPVMTQPKITKGEKEIYEKQLIDSGHQDEVHKPGDIGEYRNREDNIAVNEARENHPEMKINDVSDLSKEEQPETYIDKEIREKEELEETIKLREKIQNSLK